MLRSALKFGINRTHRITSYMISTAGKVKSHHVQTAEDWVKKFWDTDALFWHYTEPFPSLVRQYDRFIGKGKKRIFLPMSGKSVDQMWLANKGHEVVGVEFAEKGVKATFDDANVKYTVTKQGKFDVYKSTDDSCSLTIYKGDFFELDAGEIGKFDAVWDKGGFCIFNKEQQQKYAEFVVKVLKSKANFLLLTTLYDDTKFEGPPVSSSEDYLHQTFGKHFQLENVEKFPKETWPKEWGLDQFLLVITLLTATN